MGRTTTEAETTLYEEWGDCPERWILVAAWHKVQLAQRRAARAMERYGPESTPARRAQRKVDVISDGYVDLFRALANVGLIQIGE